MARRIDGAGRFAVPGPGATWWSEHLRSEHLSVGTYCIAAGGADDQVPHGEDEVYVVTAGAASLAVDRGALRVRAGDAVFVAAGEWHAFVDVSEDFAALVVFAPPHEPAP